MGINNFIAFFTVCGFFLGLICAVFNMQDPFDIFAFAGFSTFVFYLLIHIVIMNFIDAKKLNTRVFNKKQHEDQANHFIDELKIRELKSEKLINSVEEELALIQKNSNKKIRKTNAQAA